MICHEAREPCNRAKGGPGRKGPSLMRMVVSQGRSWFAAPMFLLFCTVSAAAELPPLCVEISPESPLLIFHDSGRDCPNAGAHAQHAIDAWKTLPEPLRPFSVMLVEARGTDQTARFQWYKDLMAALQSANIPTMIRVADADVRRAMPVGRVDELLQAYSCIKGIQVTGLPFEDYSEFGDPGLGTPAPIRWLIEAIDLAAKNGRLISIELDQIRWPRAMANATCEPLYKKLRECAPYVVGVAACRGAHTIPQATALMGLWLEGALGNWGVGPQSAWYSDALFISPGVFGAATQPAKMPASLYRAMIFMGAMGGACAYSFEMDSDLWFGPQRHFWDEAIQPALSSLIEQGLIPRQDLVRKKTPIGFQLAPALTPEDFHLNLRDIDGVLDKGFLMHGAYGMERPGQVSELIPNTGRHYLVPILSAFAKEDTLASFATLVRPGAQSSPDAWAQRLDAKCAPDGEGTALTVRIGRATFVMNTCENRVEPQTFKVLELPAPVRGIEAKRQDSGIVITWPFREGDLSYKVHRRMGSEARFTLLTEALEERRFVDTAADPNQNVYYSVTALTDDKEPYEGIVGYGDYLAFSNVESRIGEEVMLTPILGFAQSKPVETSASGQSTGLWWPNLDGVAESELPVANAIIQRIEAWDRAVTQENLGFVAGLYTPDYRDPEGWGAQYALRAFQWFFEHYNACCMHRQIRQWDFAAYQATGQVGVLLYCRFTGYAVSDPGGRWADLPVYFPCTETGEVWLHFAERNGTWCLVTTNPALPNFKDLLRASASPYDVFPPGPDQPPAIR